MLVNRMRLMWREQWVVGFETQFRIAEWQKRLSGARFFLYCDGMHDLEDTLPLGTSRLEICCLTDMGEEILLLPRATDKGHRPRRETTTRSLFESEDLHVAMARVALDSLKRKLDVLTIAFQHPGDTPALKMRAPVSAGHCCAARIRGCLPPLPLLRSECLECDCGCSKQGDKGALSWYHCRPVSRDV
jgi:hypothetical protein